MKIHLQLDYIIFAIVLAFCIIQTAIAQEKVCNDTWTPPSDWKSVHTPIVYRSMDNTTCLKNKNNVQIVSGKFDNAVRTGHSHDQWVDLGDLSNACITNPEACGHKGCSASLWMELSSCSKGRCALSSLHQEPTTRGFMVLCDTDKIYYAVFDKDGSAISYFDRPNGWFHLVLNHKCGETTVYVDGVQANTPSKWNKFKEKMISGDGRVVIGKCFTNIDFMFGSVMLDELTFWNHYLSFQEIEAIYKMQK